MNFIQLSDRELEAYGQDCNRIQLVAAKAQ